MGFAAYKDAINQCLRNMTEIIFRCPEAKSHRLYLLVICAVMDYFEIFVTRMLLCPKAADRPGLHFRLHIDGGTIL